MKRASRKICKEFGVTLFDKGEIIYENAQPEDFTPLHPDVVYLISDPNHKKDSNR